MKTIFAVLLVITSHYMALGQNKNNIYVDVALNYPGISATYDKKMTRHLDLGFGLSAYNFNDMSYATIRSACYADLRLYKEARRNLFFGFADIGPALNGGREPNDATMSPFGLYTTLGFGYCYRISKRGMGPYVSLGLYGYTESIHYKNPPPTPRLKDYTIEDANGLLSVGFKF
jgi:hypothetical protein